MIDPAREIYWRKKLRRLRFNAEPLSVQVEKYRLSTKVLSAVIGGVSLMFLAIFTAFRRPDIALIFIAVVFGPIVALSWWDFKRLERNFVAYQKEQGPRSD